MASIKGYKFDDELQAVNACEKCNAFYGLPVNENDVTQNWVDYRIAILNEPQFWFIVFDESLLPVFGEPIEFEVNETPIG